MDLGLRTIYGQEDLERASLAPDKIVGMCSNFESMKGSGGTLTSDKLDSGLGEEVDDCDLSLGDDPPAPPKLITVDTEKQDSGLGGEEESGDEVETDHVAVETRVPPKVLSSRPIMENSKPASRPVPHRPKKTIAPGRASTMRYSAPSQPSSLTTSSASASTAYHSNAVPAQAEEELQRLHLQNQWQRFLFQQQLHYLLPNREGDT